MKYSNLSFFDPLIFSLTYILIFLFTYVDFISMSSGPVVSVYDRRILLFCYLFLDSSYWCLFFLFRMFVMLNLYSLSCVVISVVSNVFVSIMTFIESDDINF